MRPAPLGLKLLSQNLLKAAQALALNGSAAAVAAGSGIWFEIWFVGQGEGQEGFSLSESPCP